MPIPNKRLDRKFFPEWASRLLGASWDIGARSLQYVFIPIVISGFLAVLLLKSSGMAQVWVDAGYLKNLSEATTFAFLQIGFIALWIWLALSKRQDKDHLIGLSILVDASAFSATNAGTAQYYIASAVFVFWDCPASRELRGKSSSD